MEETNMNHPFHPIDDTSTTCQQCGMVDSLVDKAVQKYVNGKIDRMNQTLEEHIKQHTYDAQDIRAKLDKESDKYILSDFIPMLLEYKERIAFENHAKIWGERIKFGGAVIVGGTTIIAVVKYVLLGKI
jgi:hypothetical protein